MINADEYKYYTVVEVTQNREFTICEHSNMRSAMDEVAEILKYRNIELRIYLESRTLMIDYNRETFKVGRS